VVISNCAKAFSVAVTATSLSPQLAYSLDGGATYVDNAGVFTNVEAGTYSLWVKDGNGCVVDTTVVVHPILEASAVLTKALDCSASPEAEISIEAIQGSGSYQYQITDGTTDLVARTNMTANTLNYTTPVAGSYVVTIYDLGTTQECSRSFSVVVPAMSLPDFDYQATNVSCSGIADGKIKLAFNDNGLNPLTFTILPNAGNFDVSTLTYANLPSGTYAVTATGSNGCDTVISSIQITEPVAITMGAASIVNFSCAAGNTTTSASITAGTVAGGSNAYTLYEFFNTQGTATETDDVLLQSSSNNILLITKTTGMTVAIHVYDDAGCKGISQEVLAAFDELLEPLISIVEEISCVNGGESISITAKGSLSDSNAALHNYSFKNLATGESNTTGDFTSLAIGNYEFEVLNTDTGCKTTINYSVEEPANFDILLEKEDDMTCFNTETGSIRIGIVNTTYQGAYQWEIFDTNGTLADLSDDLSYKNGNETSEITTVGVSVRKGTYRVVVTQSDLPECSKTGYISVDGPEAAITATVTEIENVQCSNQNGKLLVNPTGGKAPYMITISSPTQTITKANVDSYIFDKLEAGLFSIIITDAFACENTSYTYELVKPEPIKATISPDSVLQCIENTDGTITATVNSGGYGLLQYQLNRYDTSGVFLESSTLKQTSATFNNLTSGIYSITISDEGNCGMETEKTTVEKPDTIVASLLRTTPLGCSTDAVLSLNVTGGTGPYEWSLTAASGFKNLSGGDTHSFTVPAGTYTYYVKDSYNCAAVLSNSISEEEIRELSAVIDSEAAQVSCSGDATAAIYLKADGGLGDYTYELFSDSSFLNSLAMQTGDGAFEDLAAGDYYARVKSYDCEWESSLIKILDPEPLIEGPNTSATNVSCHGLEDGKINVELLGGSGDFQYAISPNLDKFEDDGLFENLAAGEYTVHAQDTKGCFMTLLYTIEEPALLMVTAESTPEICVGNTDGTITLEITGGTAPYFTRLSTDAAAQFVERKLEYVNLAFGLYTIFIKDANGCEEKIIVEVDMGVNLNAEVTPKYSCSDVSAIASINVDFVDVIEIDELLFTLDNDEESLEPNFEDIAPGMHTLTITHKDGCVKEIEFAIDELEPLQLKLTQEKLNYIKTEVSGGKAPYEISYQEEPSTTATEYYITRTDTYQVTVTDANGCSVTQLIEMEFIDVEIPNFFTPDGDGENDRWFPLNIEEYPDLMIKVYDRYGRILYTLTSEENGWDGLYNKTNAPSGDYWYVVKLNGKDDSREFIGHFTLYR
jgi:gliding motility-associated-like protein